MNFTLLCILGLALFGGLTALCFMFSRKGYRKSIKNRVLRGLMVWNGAHAAIFALMLLV